MPERKKTIDPSRYAYEEVTYSPKQLATLAELERAVRERLAAKPRRLAHSRSVAHTAEALAVRYGVDPFSARAAGTLHDWDKILTREEQLAKARRMGVDLGVALELVVPLLHGLTAAHELRERFTSLPAGVFQAIARHTIGHTDMTPLDMVVFVADGIEPLRKPVEAIEAQRGMVAANMPLADVYWETFSKGVAYVIITERYLYPGTLDIYNELALRRDGRAPRKD